MSILCGSCLSFLLHYPKIHNIISNWFLQKPNREDCFSSLAPTIPSAVAPFPLCSLDSHHMQQRDVHGHNRTLLENKSYFPSAAKTSTYLTHSHFMLFLTFAVWVVTFDSNEWVTQHFKKKTKHTRKLREKKMGTSIDLCRHVDHSFFLSQSSVNPLIMLNISGYYLVSPEEEDAKIVQKFT